MEGYYKTREDNVHQRRSTDNGDNATARAGSAKGEHEGKNSAAIPKKKTWKKPKDMPKRPMSGYNLFFQLERERLLRGQPERLFTREDVDRIAEAQKHKDTVVQPKRKHRKSHGKLGFAELARLTAAAWKSLDNDAKAVFEERAAIEKEEYKQALKVWSLSIKKSSPPADNFLATPSLDYSPIPLQPPKPVSSQRQFASDGLRDDFHYARSQDVQLGCVPAQEPVFQDCSQSGSYVRSVDPGPQRGFNFTTGNPRPGSLPPNEMLYSTDIGFCTSEAVDSGHGTTSQAFRRQSASNYNLPNEAPTLHYQVRYRRQSTPIHSARPSPVASVQIRSPEYQRSYGIATNAHASFPGGMLEPYHPSGEHTDSIRTVDSISNWSQQFVPRQTTRHRPGLQTLPSLEAPQQHRSIHLPFQRSAQVHLEEGRYPGPELQEVIATAAEGPETPEEEEQMNRLLRSYEC